MMKFFCQALQTLFALSLVAFFSSCSSTSPTQPDLQSPFSTPYYPLQVGNLWRYTITRDKSPVDTLIVLCKAMRLYSSYAEFDMVDSVVSKNSNEVSHYTLRQVNNRLVSSLGWSIYFDVDTTDTDVIKGYVMNRCDTLSCKAGLFSDIVCIKFPIADVDGMGFQYYAKNVGMLAYVGERAPVGLIGAKVGSKVYGKP